MDTAQRPGGLQRQGRQLPGHLGLEEHAWRVHPRRRGHHRRHGANRGRDRLQEAPDQEAEEARHREDCHQQVEGRDGSKNDKSLNLKEHLDLGHN